MKKVFEIIGRFLFAAVQLSWGLPQTFVGLIVFCVSKGKTDWYRLAVHKTWKNEGGLSLGLFMFTPKNATRRILDHEYGHTLQSLILGPLYLPVIGLPSLVWCNSKTLSRYRKEEKRDYFSFYTEKTADILGKADKETKHDEVEEIHHTYNS